MLIKVISIGNIIMLIKAMNQYLVTGCEDICTLKKSEQNFCFNFYNFI